jgi:hypothetical protein
MSPVHKRNTSANPPETEHVHRRIRAGQEEAAKAPPSPPFDASWRPVGVRNPSESRYPIVDTPQFGPIRQICWSKACFVPLWGSVLQDRWVQCGDRILELAETGALEHDHDGGDVVAAATSAASTTSERGLLGGPSGGEERLYVSRHQPLRQAVRTQQQAQPPARAPTPVVRDSLDVETDGPGDHGSCWALPAARCLRRGSTSSCTTE